MCTGILLSPVSVHPQTGIFNGGGGRGGGTSDQ